MGIALIAATTSCKKDSEEKANMYGDYSGYAFSSLPEFAEDSLYTQKFYVAKLDDSTIVGVNIAVSGSISAKLSISLTDLTNGTYRLPGGSVNGTFFNVKNVGVSNTRETFKFEGGKRYLNSSTNTTFDGFCYLYQGVTLFDLGLSGTLTLSEEADVFVDIHGEK